MKLLNNVYLEEFVVVARRAFSAWNREPASASFGSFDRPYWGWKYKDFSDVTMQYAVKLAVEYARHRGCTDTLPVLLEYFVRYCRAVQWRDGSFDQCYPHERTPGVIYDILSTLIYVRTSPYLQDPCARTMLDEILERGVGFALRTDEKHGAVANHIAQYAYELLNYAQYSGDLQPRARAMEYLDRLMSLFNRDEGWFKEYEGADPGYQTRCLRYLVKIAVLLDEAELWQTIRKAAEFIWEMMMPDGSIHPMLGCRSVALIYPSAFEILAARDNSYCGLAALVRMGWRNSRVPLPSTLDFGNAIRLADDAWDAACCVKEIDETADAAVTRDADCHFKGAGVVIRRTPISALYIGYRLGGVVVLYTRTEDGNWRLAYEDSGFLLEHNKRRWLNRMPGSGELDLNEPGAIRIRSKFFLALHDEITPLQLVLLRALNFTVLRLQWAADSFRRLVVRRLMTRMRPAPVNLVREITMADGKLTVADRFEASEPWWQARLYRCRRVIGTHMASSRYFQEQELEHASTDWMEAATLEPNSPLRAEVRIGELQ